MEGSGSRYDKLSNHKQKVLLCGHSEASAALHAAFSLVALHIIAPHMYTTLTSSGSSLQQIEWRADLARIEATCKCSMIMCNTFCRASRVSFLWWASWWAIPNLITT